MTLEDFYFISQIIAALGIMLSLIFVGLQVRQANEQARKAEAARRAYVSSGKTDEVTTHISDMDESHAQAFFATRIENAAH